MSYSWLLTPVGVQVHFMGVIRICSKLFVYTTKDWIAGCWMYTAGRNDWRAEEFKVVHNLPSHK
jgi:hypothetical protein